MHAMAYLGIGIGNVLRAESPVDWFPSQAAVVRAESSRRRNCDEHSFWIGGIEHDRVQAHAAGARLPLGSGAVSAQCGELMPRLAAVRGAENSRILDSCVSRIGIVERRFDVPYALEFPGVLRSVVPLVRCQGLAGFGRSVVGEFIARRRRQATRRHRFAAGCFPRLVAGALPLAELSGPAAWF